MTNKILVDVSSYQPVSMAQYAKTGSTGAIVKLTQGTYYHNPRAAGQIQSAKANRMLAAGYFYANFSGSVAGAVRESNYAIAAARSFGLSVGSYLAVDWEAGSGNSTTYGAANNTAAIITAMKVIKQAGYKPLLYSGAALMKTAMNTSSITAQFGTCLWVASYPTMAAVNQPDMNYFPSMNGVALWQFTDNWCGFSADASVAVVDLGTNKPIAVGVDEELSWHPEVKYNELGQFKVNRQNGAALYADNKLAKKIDTRKFGSTFKIGRATNGAVQAGTNQWFSQADGLTKINPLAVNTNAKAICKIIADDTWTQNEAKAGQKGIKKLPKGNQYNVFGRVGQYLLVGNETTGKYVDGNKCLIVL